MLQVASIARDAAAYVGMFAAAAGAVVTLWTLGRKTLAAVHSFYHKVDAAFGQLQPNGGKTLVDRVQSIERTVQAIAAESGLQSHRFRALAENLNYAHFEADAEGAWTYASRALAELTNVHVDDLLSWGWVSAVHPEDRERVVREWHNSRKSAGSRFTARFRFWTPTGQRDVAVVAEAYPVRSHSGDAAHWFGTISPIKERANGPETV